MSGVAEILLIVVIILAILFLPRLAIKKKENPEQRSYWRQKVSGKMRIAILSSFLWPSAAALWLKPWEGHIISFLYIGIAPILILWGIGWIIEGYRKGEK